MPDIVLKDYNGNDVSYVGVEKIVLKDTEGNNVEFSIGGGSGGSTQAGEVNFYDYDGTLVASYTLGEAQTLTELPTTPEHEGLVFQGWGLSLEDVNALTQPMNIVATYITDDGNTRLHIRIYDTSRANVPLYFSQTVANGVTINWGDGSATETLSGTGNRFTTHQYSSTGDYTISLSVADGCTLGLGHNSENYCVMGKTIDDNKVYLCSLQNVHIGDGVTKIGSYAFKYCHSLTNITIPNGVTSIESNAFMSCFSLTNITIPNSVTKIESGTFMSCGSLTNITIPNSVTSIRNSAFKYCNSLGNITIPNSVTSIGSNAFEGCSSLGNITIPNSVTSIGSDVFTSCSSLGNITIPNSVTSITYGSFTHCFALTNITIPNSVTSIENNAFYNCIGIGAFYVKPTTPPVLYTTGAFSYIPSDCIIYVPKGCLEAYQSATNWATYASYMREEE